tara:strand:- start:19 stop:354 length:336 start_codon:yes stop_codon:yes gene_type:complete
MSDFHNTSLDQKDYWDTQSDKQAALELSEMTLSNCWRHQGFCDFYQDVAIAADKTMGTEEHYDRWEDDEDALLVVLDYFCNHHTAADCADAILQGEAEQAAEAIVRDGGIF